MISPASGIHRPSNNGAPAKQTFPASKSEAMIWSVMLHSSQAAPCGTKSAINVPGAFAKAARIARRSNCVIKPS
jgi:hypothetical protein